MLISFLLAQCEAMLIKLLDQILTADDILLAIEKVLKAICQVIIKANHPSTFLTKACIDILAVCNQLDADRAPQVPPPAPVPSKPVIGITMTPTE